MNVSVCLTFYTLPNKNQCFMGGGGSQNNSFLLENLKIKPLSTQYMYYKDYRQSPLCFSSPSS